MKFNDMVHAMKHHKTYTDIPNGMIKSGDMDLSSTEYAEHHYEQCMSKFGNEITVVGITFRLEIDSGAFGAFVRYSDGVRYSLYPPVFDELNDDEFYHTDWYFYDEYEGDTIFGGTSPTDEDFTQDINDYMRIHKD